MLYLFTLGFHADHAIRRLLKARDIESIVIVTGKPMVRAVSQAYSEIVAVCEKAGLPTPKLIELPIDDPGTAVYLVYREVRGYQHIVADLSGGMRPVVVLTLLALSLATTSSFVEIYVAGEREDLPETKLVLNLITNLVSRSLSEEKLKILEILWKTPGVSQHDIAQIIGRSDRTVRAHLSELKKLDLVENRGGTLHPTQWTRLALELHNRL